MTDIKPDDSISDTETKYNSSQNAPKTVTIELAMAIACLVAIVALVFILNLVVTIIIHWRTPMESRAERTVIRLKRARTEHGKLEHFEAENDYYEGGREMPNTTENDYYEGGMSRVTENDYYDIDL